MSRRSVHMETIERVEYCLENYIIHVKLGGLNYGHSTDYET